MLDTKVRLAVRINRLIKRKRLTQVTAAACLGVSQPRIASLKNCELDGLPVERLMSYLLALGQDRLVRRQRVPGSQVAKS